MGSIYRDSLRVMCDGPFVEDWEFQTLMGVTRSEMRNLYEGWSEPPSDKALSVVRDALNNLLGYPHGRLSKVEEMMGVNKENMLIALQNVRGRDLR